MSLRDLVSSWQKSSLLLFSLQKKLSVFVAKKTLFSYSLCKKKLSTSSRLNGFVAKKNSLLIKKNLVPLHDLVSLWQKKLSSPILFVKKNLVPLHDLVSSWQKKTLSHILFVKKNLVPLRDLVASWQKNSLLLFSL